mmetsp:Transcript_57440/g.140181  ORF Transcript_57440/g.140181 Transcript_57440/m.140181 type:complete len:376 (-) Transcript_57440:234-1361(-)
MPRNYQTSITSRERNRIHARKTRQRKKALMESLTSKAEGLKAAQIQLKQSINEKNTASILCQLLAKNNTTVGESSSMANNNQQELKSQIEVLMRRSNDDIPDATKVPELPALILPGNHQSKMNDQGSMVAAAEETTNATSASGESAQDDGIDYDLLGKDRSTCTPAELDQIRRERNRMHAKRTRDRKRLFMEEMADVCKKLEDENALLQSHLDSLNGVPPAAAPSASGAFAGYEGYKAEHAVSVTASSPSISAADSHHHSYPPTAPAMPSMESSTLAPTVPSSIHRPSSGGRFDQIQSLLLAANAAFPTASATASGSIDSYSSTFSTSTVSSAEEDNVDSTMNGPPTKRRRRGTSTVSPTRKPTGFRSPPTTIGV